MRKELVIQNSSIFNDKNIKTNECIDILIDLIYLLNQGKNLHLKKKKLYFLIHQNFFIQQIYH